MSEYKLYCFGESGNAYKVALMLQLTGADWEAVPVDFFNGEGRSEAYRRDVNVMGEVPVLEHKTKNGIEKITQSGVMLDYLSETTGKFGANTPQERREIWRWILFDNHKFTANFSTLRFLIAIMKTGETPATEFLRGRAKAAYAVLDQHLSDKKFVVGERLTIADLSLAGYVFYPERAGLEISDYPHIAAWAKRISETPGWKAPYDLMPRAKPPKPKA